MARITNTEEINLIAGDQQKPDYHRPEIILELELEVKTGSPVNIDPLDVFNEGQ